MAIHQPGEWLPWYIIFIFEKFCIFSTYSLFIHLSKTWDNELAELAKYNTLQCKKDPDVCRSTHKFWVAGQNLAIHDEDEDTFIAGWAPGHWFDEYPECNLDNIRSFHDTKASNG